MADVNVTILGLERLGTSFGLALKRYMAQDGAKHKFTITGFDERSYNEKTARKRGAIDNTARRPVGAVENAHIVLLTEPYFTTETRLQEISPALMPGAVVLDTAPLKVPSITWAKDYLTADPERAAYMVGITPVLNPEVLHESNIEIEGAREDLFDRGTLVLAPAADCPAEAVELASEVARIIGASVHFMDPAEHDGLAAAMEGMPALMTTALFRMYATAEAWDDLRRLANPSFGLATQHLRYQHADSLWGLLYKNRDNTTRYLTALIETLTDLRDSMLEDEDGLALEAVLVENAEKYKEWENQRLANRWEKEDDAPTGDGFMSTMGGMLFGRRTKKDDKTQ